LALAAAQAGTSPASHRAARASGFGVQADASASAAVHWLLLIAVYGRLTLKAFLVFPLDWDFLAYHLPGALATFGLTSYTPEPRLVAVIAGFPPLPRVVAGALVLALVFLGATRTFARNHDWKDNLTIFERAAAASPRSCKAVGAYALLLKEADAAGAAVWGSAFSGAAGVAGSA
jgi:hypothetical protein